MRTSFTVHDLPLQERPRERLASFGPQALSSAELIAIIIGSGMKGEPVMLTAQKLLSEFGSLEGIQEASLQDLQKVRGFGIAKACQIKACFEISRRLGTSLDTLQKPKEILSADTLYPLIRKEIASHAKEHFIVLSFDSRNALLGMDTISMGTVNASLVHPRETFEPAIRRHATAIIVAHNHPSGNPDPSTEDIAVTRLLLDAGTILKINLLDHIIVTKQTYFSFRNGEMIGQ